jgi:hypothetical protein
MNETPFPTDLRAALDLGRLLGQRRAFAAVVGRCSAAHAQLLRRIHDEKLYLPIALSWEAFCGNHLAIEPAVREQTLLVNGEAVTLIPENAPKILEAVGEVLHKSRRARRPARTPETLRTRLAGIASRGRVDANQLVALYHSSCSGRDRELILEVATELRLILMQPGLDSAARAFAVHFARSPGSPATQDII